MLKVHLSEPEHIKRQLRIAITVIFFYFFFLVLFPPFCRFFCLFPPRLVLPSVVALKNKC